MTFQGAHASERDARRHATDGSTHLSGGWTLDDPRLSQPLYKTTIETELQIPTRNGFSIAATVYRPKVPPGVNVPNVLVY